MNLIEKDKRHIIHPWSDLGSDADSMIIESGKGVHVFDNEGNRYLDAISGMWCVNLGYGNPEMAKAISDQCLQLTYYTPFGAMTSPPSIQLANELSKITPGDLNFFQFTTGGSTAVESAIRFVHYYFNCLGRPEKKHIIYRENAYHGSTYLAASLNGKKCDRSYFDYVDDIVHSTSDPNPYKRPDGMSVEDFCDLKVSELKDKILEIGPDKVACFIAEPIMGSGGVIVPPPGYHKKTLDICREYEVLYISDEVVTAFGRLGHNFASEDVFGIVPDIITVAKGITSGYQPLGAAIISDKLVNRISGEFANENSYFTNGFTYSGHPVTCAAALKYLEIMKREKINEHVREVGAYFMKRLETLTELSIVGDVRGLYLMACVECVVSDNEEENIAVAQRVDEFCQEKGLIVRPYENLCILSPPLITDKAGADQIVDILRDSIMSTMAEIG
ncbi:aminotransferase [Desulfobacterales bacterium HSG17]|nr:aminotransferase [Desulfobacterales bacterium HSG17]